MSEINTKLQELETSVKEQLKQHIHDAEQKNAAAVKSSAEGLQNTINEWKAEVKNASETKQKQLDAIEVSLKKLKSEGASAAQAMTKATHQILAEKFAEKSDAFKGRESGLLKYESFEMKAAATMTFSQSTTGTVVDRQYVPGIYGTVRRRDRIRGLLNQGVMSGDALEYVVQTGGEGGANNVNEGGSKPQTDKDIALKTAPARKIAHHIRVSDELLNDLNGLAAFLTFQGTEDVYDKEDQQLLFGTGTGTPTQLEGLTVGTGLLTAADTALTGVTNPQKVDAVTAACEALAGAEYMCDTIIMNPADVYSINVLKGSDSDYLRRVNFTTDGRLVIGGIPVAVSTAMTAGSFLAAELNRAAVMYQRDGLSVRFYDQDQDNAILNLVTVVIEERIALAKPYQNAVFFDTFADVITAIS